MEPQCPNRGLSGSRDLASRPKGPPNLSEPEKPASPPILHPKHLRRRQPEAYLRPLLPTVVLLRTAVPCANFHD